MHHQVATSFTHYWCFNPDLQKKEAYKGAYRLGVSFKNNTDFEIIVKKLINKKCNDYWTNTVKTLMDTVIVMEGKDDVDLGIPGQYYMFEDEDFPVRALEEFLTSNKKL